MRAAHAGAPVDSDALAVNGSRIEAARGERLASSYERELRDAIQGAGFRPLEVRRRVPVDQGADLHAGARGDFFRKASHTGTARGKGTMEGLDAGAKRRNDSDPGDGDAARRHRGSHVHRGSCFH